MSWKTKLAPGRVIETIRARQEDSIVVGGTLVEGIGNHLSDLDVYVLTRSPPQAASFDLRATNWLADANRKQILPGSIDSEVFHQHEYLNTKEGGDVALECYYWTEHDILGVFASIEERYEGSLSTMKIIRSLFDNYQSSLVHRLWTGECIQSTDIYLELLPKIPIEKYRYLMYRNFNGAHPEFKDLCGWWRAREYEACLLRARDYMFSQMQALLFLFGNTNPRRKWVLHKMALLPPSLEMLGCKFRMVLFESARNEEEQRFLIQSALDVVDEIWLAGATQLNTLIDLPNSEHCASIVELEFKDRPRSTPHLALEREQRLKVYRNDLRPSREFLDIY